MLEINQHDAPGAAVGSLEGDGIVTMGARNLNVGSNSLSTAFSGTLEGDPGSSLTKVGTGTLTLSGANTYTDGTTILSGSLKVNNTAGSGTGTGTVQVSGGILGGKGIIAGTVTIGTGSSIGSSLQPGTGASTPTTLTLQNSLTFNSDGTYTWKLNTKKAKADKVIVSGATIRAGAQFSFSRVGNKKLTTGKVFTAIDNTSASPISGTFANLADGSTVTIGVNKLQVSYSGGDGNDLTLTVVP
jgi:autotransporter-associated beta strand protein